MCSAHKEYYFDKVALTVQLAGVSSCICCKSHVSAGVAGLDNTLYTLQVQVTAGLRASYTRPTCHGLLTAYTQLMSAANCCDLLIPVHVHKYSLKINALFKLNKTSV